MKVTFQKCVGCGACRYPWHDKGEYRHLMGPGDEDLEYWVKLFNTFDLYTKDQVGDGVRVRGRGMVRVRVRVSARARVRI